MQLVQAFVGPFEVLDAVIGLHSVDVVDVSAAGNLGQERMSHKAMDQMLSNLLIRSSEAYRKVAVATLPRPEYASGE